jgi:hypothetical protein
MLLNCFSCEVELDVPYDVIAADPYRDDFYCNPCDDDLQARYYGWMPNNADDYALASAGYGSDEDY